MFITTTLTPLSLPQIGIYGFIFCRDGDWVDVIIDEYVLPAMMLEQTLDCPFLSQLFTSIPRWEAIGAEVRTFSIT